MKELLLGALHHALAETEPRARVKEALSKLDFAPSHILAVGKAAAGMLEGAKEVFPKAEALLVLPHGYPAPPGVEVVYAGHPVPDEGSLLAGERALALARGLSEGDRLLVLLSGGGSALLSAPWGVGLEEKKALTEALLKSGATIHEINAVRKHLSRVKGGRLAEAAYPAEVLTLIYSDVPGDDVSVVASGPTAPDPTTFEDALFVLGRYGLDFPRVREHLSAGVRGELPETPKPGSPVFSRVENRVAAANADLLAAASDYLRERGYATLVLSDRFTLEAKDLARAHAEVVESARARGIPLKPPFFLVSGGEASVRVRGPGRGGRNQEFLLALLKELGPRGVYALAADTDGKDGPTEAAGAVLTPDSFHRSLALGLDPRLYLERNDAYSFFEALGDLVVTGPTGNNLNDLRLVFVGEEPHAP